MNAALNFLKLPNSAVSAASRDLLCDNGLFYHRKKFPLFKLQIKTKIWF